MFQYLMERACCTSSSKSVGIIVKKRLPEFNSQMWWKLQEPVSSYTLGKLHIGIYKGCYSMHKFCASLGCVKQVIEKAIEHQIPLQTVQTMTSISCWERERQFSLIFQFCQYKTSAIRLSKLQLIYVYLTATSKHFLRSHNSYLFHSHMKTSILFLSMPFSKQAESASPNTN